jgi:hypothetical protein
MVDGVWWEGGAFFSGETGLEGMVCWGREIQDVTDFVVGCEHGRLTGEWLGIAFSVYLGCSRFVLTSLTCWTVRLVFSPTFLCHS